MPQPDPAIPLPRPGETETEKRAAEPKGDAMRREREVERDEGIVPERRGTPAAPSDRPEDRPPHPQDVNEITAE